MLITAVAFVALAVPIGASAKTPTLFDHTGQLPVGEKFLTTSPNVVLTTGFGNTQCAQVTITGKVTQNASGTVKAVSEGVGFGTNCSLGGKPIPVTDFTVAELHTGVAGSGTINITFKSTYPGETVCHFSAVVPFTYTAGVTNDTIQITKGDMTGSPAACEPGLLSATFTLETDVSPFAPIWFQ